MSYSKRKLSVTKKSRSKDAWGYTTEDLPSLRRKRTLAYNRLTKAYEVATLTTNDPSQIELFLSYYQEIKKIAGTFEEAHLTILDLLDEPEEDELICTRFDDMYYEIIRIHRSITKSISQNSESALEHINSQTTSSHVKLPKITLPSFSGNIKEWPKFIATYDNLFHNARLSDTDKFNYLTSVLQGDALALIRTFPATGDHYSDAYTKLVTRYESKRDLAFTCWRDILNADFKLHNAHDFRRSLDMFDENLTILKRLNLPVDQWDFVLSYHILSKLDPKLRREFEEKHPNIELPSYADLQSFLYSKCEALIRDTHFTESGHFSSNPLCSKEQYTKPNPNIRSIKPKASHSLVAAQDCTDNDGMCGALVASHSPQPTPPLSKPVLKCTYCSDVHSITSCKSFIQNTVDERINIARNNKWCFNCLRTSHTIRDCKSIFSCQKCKHRHHTLLHKDVEPAPASPSHTTLITRHEFACTSPTVLLATAIVYVRNSLGDSLAFRAVFDTGSQNNFITQKAADRLCFTPRPASVNITGIGGTEALINGVVRCNLGTACTPLFELEMLVIPKICSDQPIAKLNSHGWSNIKTLQLADPGFDIPGPVDILLGADVFAESLLNERIKGQGSQPPALRSVFGWLLLGKTSVVHSSLLGIHATTDSEQLTSIVQRFWEVDSVPQASIFTPQEQLCERKYVSEHSRDPTGRYVVTLPFKDDSVPVFSGSRDIALRRFFALERRLSRDPDLRAQYVEFMDDYLNSGHMSLVPRTKLGHGRYYIPHHGILKPESTTTKLRVVFDASAKDFMGKSLNDTLLTGPKLHNDIFSILLRFREHKVVFMADVRQMYRQILVTETQRDYQRVLWRSHSTEPIKEYVLNTVTYGTSAAPFLACRTLLQLAYDEGDVFPVAKRILLSDIYVDDVVTGCNSMLEAREAKSQVIRLFSKGHLHLRKWASNVSELIDDIPDEHKLLKDTVNFDETQNVTLKVLGLRWEPSCDSFVFDVAPMQQPCTKRNILSELARIFDPLGFLSPLTIQAKCLIQRLWIIGIPWDETPPHDVLDHWSQYLTQLPQLKRLRVPRCVNGIAAPTFELHGFCDASERAYGAVIYIRVFDHSGTTQTFLLCAKARVAPIKQISLPRLELCAAVLLVQLTISAKTVSRLPLKGLYLLHNRFVMATITLLTLDHVCSEPCELHSGQRTNSILATCTDKR